VKLGNSQKSRRDENIIGSVRRHCTKFPTKDEPYRGDNIDLNL